jgi:hypothetical protein
VNKNIETLATALYVTIDAMVKVWPGFALVCPAPGYRSCAQCSGAANAGGDFGLAGFTCEPRWLRFVNEEPAGMFPYNPEEAGL